MMWFRLPEGVDNISVERQAFATEVRDSSGRGYFRAPDHFAPTLMSIPGFGAASPPESVDLTGLPEINTSAPSEISEQAQKITALEDLVSSLRTDLSQRSAELAATLHERDELKLKLHEAEVKIADLEEKNTDLEDAAPTTYNRKSK